MPPADRTVNRLEAESLVIVALGCNDKGRWASCQECLDEVLVQFGGLGLKIKAQSRWWSSLAWPDPEDPPFINGVVAIETALGPEALMLQLADIETRFGRQRTRPNAPRTLDLDLIAYGRLIGDLNGLILPHPRSHERRFVMGPIADICPDWPHPVFGSRAEVLAATATVGADAIPVD